MPEVDRREYFLLLANNLSSNSGQSLECTFGFLFVRYETGDHVGVLCDNLNETVEEALRLLDMSPDNYFSLHSDREDGTPNQQRASRLYDCFQYFTCLSTSLKSF